MARKSLWSTGQNRPAKGTTAYMQWQYNVSRGNLLLAIAFTVINLGMLLADSDSYFLFSIAVPYWGALLGDIFGYGDLMVTVAVVLMVVYILCFFLSKSLVKKLFCITDTTLCDILLCQTHLIKLI